MTRARHAKRSSFFSYILYFLIVLLILYPLIIARFVFVDHKKLKIQSLPRDLQGLRIVFMSDIHQGKSFSQSRVNNLVAKINDYSPDIVLMGGDYAQTPSGAIDFFQNVPTIQAKLGVFAVMGECERLDSTSGEFEILKSTMRNKNIIPLVNDVSSIRYKSSEIFLAGIDDYNEGSPNIAQVSSKVKSEDFVIFLTHTPDALPEAFRSLDAKGNPHWFDLALAGHTHGGQITLFGKPIIRNYHIVTDRYLTGWLQENRAHVLISNGIGTSLVPLRFYARAQFHVIDLE